MVGIELTEGGRGGDEGVTVGSLATGLLLDDGDFARFLRDLLLGEDEGEEGVGSTVNPVACFGTDCDLLGPDGLLVREGDAEKGMSVLGTVKGSGCERFLLLVGCGETFLELVSSLFFVVTMGIVLVLVFFVDDSCVCFVNAT